MTVLSYNQRARTSAMENFGEFVVNHWILWTLFFGLSALLIGSIISSGMNGAKIVNTSQAVQIVNQHKGQFIDTRDQAAFEKEHIADSINMPIATLDDGSAKIQNKANPVILLPAIGQNTNNAVKQLQQQGVQEVYMLKGGIQAWKDAKLPVFS